MRRAVAVVILALVLAMSSVALGSEKSKLLYSRGLVEFHAQRYAKAVELFDEALRADPNDAYALYYRGVTRGRLGDLAGAIADLDLVVAQKKPSLKQAVLELGVAQVQAGHYEDAVPPLTQAQAIPELAAQASLFLGIAQLNLGQTAAARENFQRAAVDPELQLSARYYAGVADYREGKLDDAREHFTYVVNTNPTAEVGHEAREFLDQIAQAGPTRPYLLYGAVGFQYDSNVVLAPNDGAIKSDLNISQQSDGRATINAGGMYIPWRNEQWEFSVGYDFYQSLHFELTDFNLQDHRPYGQLTWNAGPVQLGILGRYDYYFLDTDSFLQDGVGLPWVTIPEGDVGSAQVFFRVRRNDFYKQSYRIRDAVNYGTGIRQMFNLGAPERYAFLGYAFDYEDPIHLDVDSRQFGYSGNQGESGIAWGFPYAITAELDYTYRQESYFHQSQGRHDDVSYVVVALRKQLNEYLDVTAGYFGTFNYSNKAPYDYDRQIGSVALEARY